MQKEINVTIEVYENRLLDHLKWRLVRQTAENDVTS